VSFLTKEQIDKIGFASVGEHVFISDKACFYNPSRISIGSYVRIDDFCIFSAGIGGIELGDYVHISCYVSLIGESKIKMGSFCGLSSKVSVYSSSDDFSGNFLPAVKHLQEKYRNVTDKPVIFNDYSIVGASCVVLPGVVIGEGTIVGALSLIRKSLEPWKIYAGNPLKFVKSRSKEMLKFIPELKKNLEI
jgi:galactoside O-acetyltransferase